MNFQTKYDYKHSEPEKQGGETKVDTVGYISSQQRIENLMLAGQRLVAHRSQRYDFEQGSPVDENFADPTRSTNFDLADAHRIAEQVNERLLKASQTVQEPPKTILEDTNDPKVTESQNKS